MQPTRNKLVVPEDNKKLYNANTSFLILKYLFGYQEMFNEVSLTQV